MGRYRYAEDRLFTGHTRLGARSGMYYAGARFYSADLGRFMSADPLEPDYGGSPQGLNLYSYVANNPLRYTDPTGMRLLDDDCGTRSCYGPLGQPRPPQPPHNQPPVPVVPPPEVDDTPLITYNPGSSDYYGAPVPASCALYGSSPYGDCTQWEQEVTGLDLGFGLGDIWKAVTSDCAFGIASFMAAGVVTGSSIAAFGWFAASGGLATAGGYALATSLAAGGAYSLGPIPSETATAVIENTRSGFQGIQKC